LTLLEIRLSMTTIGVCAFCECSYVRVVKIPYCVMSIGDGAFWDCVSLLRLKIASSVRTIE
jgi:hypothetical protein